MPLPKELNMYHDVRLTLEAARRGGGGRLALDTEGAAKHWRQRAYYYRKLLARADARAHEKIPGYIALTEWDDMYLTCEGPEVVIRFGTIKGELKSLDGKRSLPVSAPTPKGAPAASDDPLLCEALELLQEHTGED